MRGMFEGRAPGEVERLAARFVDGELDAAEAARVEASLVRDPALGAEVERLRALRAALATDRDPGMPAPSAGFADRVLGEVRRLPRGERGPAGEAAEIDWLVPWARRIVAAAALVVLSAFALWAASVRVEQGSDEVQAAPDDVRATAEFIERLDAEIDRIEAGRTETAGREPR
jgi:anti-sigma factor RsiW